MTSSEFFGWLTEVTDALSLSVILNDPREGALVPWDHRQPTLAMFPRAYLAMDSPLVDRIDPRKLQPGRLGWVQVDLPRETEDDLFISHISARSDWFDEDASVVRKDPTAHQLYGKVWNCLRRHLSFPVWVANAKTGRSREYKSIGYSAGAAARFRGGRRLRQEGVANIRFEIRDSSPRTN